MAVNHYISGHVGVISMAETGKRNALSVEHVQQLLDAMTTLKKSARALVICSTASVFCAGADLSAQPAVGSAGTAGSAGLSPIDLFEAIAKETRPVIAAVDGAAVGGGFELTLCCDFVVASPKAYFAFPELGVGRVPGTGLARLSGLIGLRKAKELVMTRRRLSAEEALSFGLVNSVVHGNMVVQEAIALAEDIVAEAPPTAIAAVKSDFERVMDSDWNWFRDSREYLDPAEREEGVAAFIGKRKPDFQRFWNAGPLRNKG